MTSADRRCDRRPVGTASAPRPVVARARADRGRAGAALGARHLRGAGRADADRADPPGRRHACCVNALTVLLLIGVIGREVWNDHAGAPARPRRRAAACAHRRAVLGDRRGAGDPGRGRRQHHARPRPRPLVLHPHPAVIENSLDRRPGLSAASMPQTDPRRHHRDGVRRRAAPSRCSTRTASASSSS